MNRTTLDRALNVTYVVLGLAVVLLQQDNPRVVLLRGTWRGARWVERRARRLAEAAEDALLREAAP